MAQIANLWTGSNNFNKRVINNSHINSNWLGDQGLNGNDSPLAFAYKYDMIKIWN